MAVMMQATTGMSCRGLRLVRWGHNLAKATASHSPGKNMRADVLRCSCALDPHAVYHFHSGFGEVGDDLSPAY